MSYDKLSLVYISDEVLWTIQEILDQYHAWWRPDSWRCLVISSYDTDFVELTHWGLEMHICVGKVTIVDSDNGLAPGRRQSIISTNGGVLMIQTLGTNISDIWSEIHSCHSRNAFVNVNCEIAAIFVSASMC